MNNKMEKENIVKAIKAQNKCSFKELKCHKVYESKKFKGVYNSVIEVDGESFKQIMECRGKLNVGWTDVKCMSTTA